MPNGLPGSEQLMSGEVGGYSIDTCIFEALGFRLDTGEFGVLHQQLPPWMKLFIPSVVRREVIGHQVANVDRCAQELTGILRNIHRHTGLNLGLVMAAINELKLNESGQSFDAQFVQFLKRCNGQVLNEGGENLLKEMLDRYFELKPPFGAAKDRKCEFPDAAALLSLERRAKKMKRLFVVVSKDGSWQTFCDESNWLYCVDDLRKLTALYQADDTTAANIESSVSGLLSNQSSPLYNQVVSALEDGIPDSSWVVDAYTGYCSGIEAELQSAAYLDFDPTLLSFRLWMSPDASAGVVEIELNVHCGFDVRAEFSTWDSIDHESVPIGTGDKIFSSSVSMKLYISLTGDLCRGNPNDWRVEVSLSHDDYVIDAGEMEPDYQGYED